MCAIGHSWNRSVHIDELLDEENPLGHIGGDA